MILFTTSQPYGIRIKQRCQAAIFNNTETQWVNSWTIIKKSLCAFNSDWQWEDKTHIPGGAASAPGGRLRQSQRLAMRWHCEREFICRRKLAPIETGHQLTAGFRGNMLKGANRLIFSGNITRLSHTYTWQVEGWGWQEHCLLQYCSLWPTDE